MTLSDQDPAGTAVPAEVLAEAVLAEVATVRARLTAAQEAASTWLPGFLAATARIADLAPALGADLAGAVRRLERDQAGFAARLDELTVRLESLDGRVATIAAQASTDPLTGVLNRAAFTAAIEEAVRGAEAVGQPLSLLFCDVDHFKEFNDGFGHHVGDHVLRLVARALDRFPGGRHVVGRLGGSKLRRQQGQRGRRRRSATARCRRKVAIEAGLCRPGRTGGTAGAVAGRPLGGLELGPPALRGSGSARPPGRRRPRCTRRRGGGSRASPGPRSGRARSPASAPRSPARCASAAWRSRPAPPAWPSPAGSRASSGSARSRPRATRRGTTPRRAARSAGSRRAPAGPGRRRSASSAGPPCPRAR